METLSDPWRGLVPDPERYQKDENYRGQVHNIIVSCIERDWYDKAKELAAAVNMPESDYNKLESSHKPNTKLVG